MTNGECRANDGGRNICRAFLRNAMASGTDALQFVHSDLFRYSSFVLRHSVSRSIAQNLKSRDVYTSLDMTKETPIRVLRGCT
jgi:hypothetical protein